MNTCISFKKSTRLFTLTSIAALGLLAASNSFAAVGTTSSTATVIVPISISTTTELVFGTFSPSGTLGTLTISPNNNVTASDVLLSSVDNTRTAAKFAVKGSKAATYSIAWSADNSLTDSVGDGADMSLDLIAETGDGTAAVGTSGSDTTVATGKLTGDAQTLSLGAILHVAGDQVAGDYAGNVTATVEYN